MTIEKSDGNSNTEPHDLYAVKFNEVNQKISRLWEPEAREVIELLDNNPMAIIVSRNANGVSYYLIPELIRLLAEQNRLGIRVNSQRLVGYAENTQLFFEKRLSKGKPKDAVLLDEAGEFTTSGLREHLTESLQLMHGKGFAVIPLISYPGDDETQGKQIARIWQEEETQQSGHVPSIYTFQRKLVEPSLAKEFLMTPKYEGDVSPSDVTDFIIQTVPLNIRIVWELRNTKRRTLDEAKEYIKGRFHMWTLNQYITPEEGRQIETRLKPGFKQ